MMDINGAQKTDLLKYPSLHRRLLLGVNGAMLLILTLFLLLDTAIEYRTQLGEKRVALAEEAQTLLPASQALRGAPASLQAYIDEVCGRMRESSSPGHHIIVLAGANVFQATAHGRDSHDMYHAVVAAAQDPDGVGNDKHAALVVGHVSSGDLAVFVSEQLVNIRQLLWAQLLRRAAGVTLLGLILGLVLNLLLNRLVNQPLARVVGAARRLATGEIGAQAPLAKTAELRYLASEFNQMSSSLAQADRQRRKQMARARRIQQRLIPMALDHPQVQAAWIYRPAEDVGGDYFDIRTQGDLVLCCVADATGHGVPAAMIASMLKILFNSAADRSDDPAAILCWINEALVAGALDEDFASMAVVAVDSRSRQIRYASAGHEPAYLLRYDQPIETLDSTGMLLGLEHPSHWETQSLSAQPGDRLVLLTDGIAETPNSQGKLFGREQLLVSLQETRHLPLDVLLAGVAERAHAHAGPQPQADDITIAGIHIT